MRLFYQKDLPSLPEYQGGRAKRGWETVSARIRVLVTVIIAALIAIPVSQGAAQKKMQVAFVPKLVGIPYFNAMEKGGNAAAKDLGVTFVYTGPTTADSAAQIQIVDNLITKGVDALSVAPNDPAAIGPILKKAQDKGIKVFTSDTDAPDSVRTVFVDQALAQDIGNTTMDELARAMGGAGEYAIVSCGPTAQNLNTWIGIEKSRQAAKYPKMKLVALKYAGEDIQQGITVARDLITAFPNLRGLIGQCSTSAPAVAEAVVQMHKIGKVFATGISVPSLMRKYVKSGAVRSFVLWDPVNLGYLTVWAGKQLVEGKAFQPVNTVPTIGKVKYLAADKILLLGPPTVFTPNNVDKYSF